MIDTPSSVPIDVTLQEIYDTICQPCREALLDFLSRKAQSNMVRNALRAQLERHDPHPEPV